VVWRTKRRMLTDFTAEYSQRSDDELLHLANQRHYMTAEAVAALDGELRRRNLTESDRVEHQKFEKRQERREGRQQTNLRRRWGSLGLKWQLKGREILELLAVMAVILVAYFALPARYHLNPDWQEAAIVVMLTSVGLAFLARSWRNIAFWISLGISSAIHLLVVHAWTRQTPELSHAEAKIAFFLGIVLFLVVYGAVRLLRRVFRGGEEGQTIHRGKDDGSPNCSVPF
jgi:cation transport ATPase